VKEILREIFKELSGECDYLEIRIEESENTNIVFAGPVLNQVSKSMEKGGYIRALYKGGWGGISFNNIDNIKEYAKSAIEQAKKVGKNNSILAPVPVVEDEVLLDLINDPRDVSFENKIELMRKYNDIVLNYHENIKSSNTAYLEKYNICQLRGNLYISRENGFIRWCSSNSFRWTKQAVWECCFCKHKGF